MNFFFNKHFEWLALTIGLVLMTTMNPYVNNGASWCLFEFVGITYCPGEGLGHSIAFFVRGEATAALEANMMGPVALIIILSRIAYLLHNLYSQGTIKHIKKHG